MLSAISAAQAVLELLIGDCHFSPVVPSSPLSMASPSRPASPQLPGGLTRGGNIAKQIFGGRASGSVRVTRGNDLPGKTCGEELLRLGSKAGRLLSLFTRTGFPVLRRNSYPGSNDLDLRCSRRICVWHHMDFSMPGS